jgi:DNA-binding response OmpR family regulator
MRILLAEDDVLLGEGLSAGLKQRDFQVDWVRDGVSAEHEMRAQPFAAAILDLGLPRLDGMAVLQSVRAANCHVPVLILTARETVADKLRGFSYGADDYILKPVDLDELAARIHAVVRRTHGQPQDSVRVQDVVLTPASRSVTLAGAPVTLSMREFDLLHVLLLNAGRVLSREQIEQRLYAWGQEVDSNAVEVHVHHLRRKLGTTLIQTVRGIGYVLHKSNNEVP